MSEITVLVVKLVGYVNYACFNNRPQQCSAHASVVFYTSRIENKDSPEHEVTELPKQ